MNFCEWDWRTGDRTAVGEGCCTYMVLVAHVNVIDPIVRARTRGVICDGSVARMHDQRYDLRAYDALRPYHARRNTTMHEPQPAPHASACPSGDHRARVTGVRTLDLEHGAANLKLRD